MRNTARALVLALCVACMAAEVLGKTRNYADAMEAKREAVLLKKQTREERKLEFRRWMDDFKKAYKSLKEENDKFEIWNANVEDAADLNLRAAGTVFYGANKFFDMTKEEWAARYLMSPTALRRMRKLLGKPRPKPKPLAQPAIPAKDWRSAGMVTDVKDQGGCGSCWAFGQGAAMESKYMIQTKTKTFDISEQQFNDCVYPGRDGCQGGWDGDVYLYAKKHGVCPEAAYTYFSGSTGVSAACQAATCSSQVGGRIQITGNANLQAAMASYVTKYPGTNFRPYPYNGGYGEYTDAYVQLVASHLAIADFVAGFNPVSFSFTVMNDFFSYAGGIYVPVSRQVAGGHLVLLVGYNMSGTDTNAWFWTVKNSWGSTWGEQGYFRIQVTAQGSCGMYANMQSPGDIAEV